MQNLSSKWSTPSQAVKPRHSLFSLSRAMSHGSGHHHQRWRFVCIFMMRSIAPTRSGLCVQPISNTLERNARSAERWSPTAAACSNNNANALALHNWTSQNQPTNKHTHAHKHVKKQTHTRTNTHTHTPSEARGQMHLTEIHACTYAYNNTLGWQMAAIYISLSLYASFCLYIFILLILLLPSSSLSQYLPISLSLSLYTAT